MRGRLALISACVLGALLVAGIYLALSPKRVVAVSKVLVERNATTKESGEPDAVIDAQADVFRSSEVLRLADSKASLGSLRTFAGVRDPVPMMRRNLSIAAKSSASGSVLTVTYPAVSEQDAIDILDAVVDAYRGYQTNQQQQKAQRLGVDLGADRKKLDDQLAAARQNLAEYDIATGGAGLDTSSARMSSVSNALTEASLATLSAKRRYDEAVTAAGDALGELDDQKLEQTLKDAGAYAPESQELIEQEVRMLESQLSDLRKTYDANHPSMVRATQRLKQVRIAQAASARARWISAQQREADLQKTFAQLQRDSNVQTTKQAERAKLAAEVSRLQARADELDGRLHEISLMTAAGSLNVSVITPAEANNPAYPPLPRYAPTLLTAGLIGLALGGLLSIAGDLRGGDRLRNLMPTRSPIPLTDRAGQTLGVKKLGALPETDPNEEGHPIELLAHADPFGEYANAIRKLRSACDIEGALPASMILTSASNGDGKTTLAVNLASTIAREGRKVLLIDMNFAQPRLHEVLGVPGDRGFLQLLEGGDAVELIRSSSIPRVDVLAAGGVPKDSALLLNGEALPHSLSMLTSAYDHVIFDGNALAIGDDARIVASLTDATILVSRDTPASLRRAAGARDMLLMVGANLLGVALTRSRPMMHPITTLQTT